MKNAYALRSAHMLALALLVLSALSGCVSIVPVDGCCAVAGGETIKVLLVSGAESVEIKDGLGAAFRVEMDGRGFTVNGRAQDLPLVFGTGHGGTGHGLVSLGNRPYRGSLVVISDKGGLMVVNELPLEDYIAGVINNEISSKWNAEAVKAQAVVSRTYALHRKAERSARPYHVEGSVMGQVYNGAAAEDAQARAAVRATEGEILYYNGAPALTVYHSNAGGMTDSSEDVWGRDYAYLKAVKSPYDALYQRYNWEYAVSAETLKGLLNRAGYVMGEPEAISAAAVTPAGRLKALVITDSVGGRVSLSGEEMRKAVGYGNLRSAMFEVERSGSGFVFRGKGSGHGVGLSQWGAKGMADDGYSYKEILSHYYPGARLVKAW